ncbi:YhfX family PLP-dependent enzyme [Planosporangium flavigriseum]|uniref:Amino-acid racemase n=1 Tax=Planosporangium flavigriseum TaxID=373681 RepID=A0A8J3LPW5_9ACTN|nr:alanine racemase [Planosporangium flavigriseum]NJC65225.1 YhfX family PLP-dependent enzyme [Planosporangium flavigriseum]GIG71844.1 amino-acid racemase [Planosporangium flavigriseum]
MFLDLLRRRNPAFLRAAAQLHHSGQLPANTYALDLDTVGANATAIKREADRLGLTPFAMTKQIGRNPDFCRTVRDAGITEAVGVDLQCALAAHQGGLRTGHLGHLVQIPRHEAATAAALRPRYWTVFNDAKAGEAAAASAALGRDQALLARIVAPGDTFYRGHEGGFDADDIVAVADRLDALDGARFAGITSFPAQLFDKATGKVLPTPNLTTLQKAAERLRAAGREHVELNAPGTTSVAILPMLAEAGATQVEPGHGLTGTTPWHAVEDLVEEPAVLYVSEVSHLHGKYAYVFGGGLYVDPVLGLGSTRALIVRGGDFDSAQLVDVEMPAPEAIDYYAMADLSNATGVAPGDTVIFGFRPQAFVTRALTAGITGVRSGAPAVAGVYAADGSVPIGLDDSADTASTESAAS